MGFFSGLLDFAKQAIPGVLGFAIGGPTGAAIGGALGGAAFGDEPLKDALLGGALGYAGGSLLGGSNPLSSFSNLFSGPALNSLTGGNPLMSLLNFGGNLYSGLSGQNAASKASQQLQAATKRGISAQNQALAKNTAAVQPYLTAGGSAATGLTNLIDPAQQAAFIQNNPFYQSLANYAKQKLFANAAATGKLGSGGTADALQNSLLLLGQNLLNQQYSNLQGVANLGLNATNQYTDLNSNYANSVSGLYKNIGEAQAGGTLSGSDALTKSIQSLIDTQGQISGINQSTSPYDTINWNQGGSTTYRL